MIKKLAASHRIGSIFGIEVRVMYFLYIFIGIVLLSQFLTRNSNVLLFSVAIMLLPLCVLMHELGHAVVAIKEGVKVDWILLHPIGGVARMRGLIPGPAAEITVALAGPFVSLLIAALAFLPILILGSSPFAALYGANFLLALCGAAFMMNMVLALFNLLPIFPMDGGRVATAIAIIVIGPERGIRAMSRIALAGVCLLGFIGLLIAYGGNYRMGFTLVLLGTFLYTTGQQELQARAYAARFLGGAVAETKKEPWSTPEWTQEKGFEKEKEAGWLDRWREKRRKKMEAAEQKERLALDSKVDTILDKVKRDGTESLTAEERDILNRASREYRNEG